MYICAAAVQHSWRKTLRLISIMHVDIIVSALECPRLGASHRVSLLGHAVSRPK